MEAIRSLAYGNDLCGRFPDNRGLDNERTGSLPHAVRYELGETSGANHADQLPNEWRGYGASCLSAAV